MGRKSQRSTQDPDDGYQHTAIAAALKIGASFYERGADLAITLPDGVVLPADLQQFLLPETLRDYLGINAAEERALEFCNSFNVDVLLVDDEPGCAMAIAALDGAKLISIDIETTTGSPSRLLINKDGSLPKPKKTTVKRNGKQRDDTDGAGLDPFRANIATIQMYAPGHGPVFILVGAAKDKLLSGGWLSKQRLVAHNAFFETLFFLHSGIRFNYPIECTMHALSLLWGPPRSLAALSERVLKRTPPKEHATSFWGAETLSDAQLAYAAGDVLVVADAGDDVFPRIHNSRRRVPYELARDAIPAVAEMQLRGLGFDRDEHAAQMGQLHRDREAAYGKYREQMDGREPPRTPAETGALIEELIQDRPEWRGREWPPTPTGRISTARVHLKRLLPHPGIATLLEIRAKSKLISAQFGEPLPDYITPATGRLHADYRIAGTITGRFSCANPNLQQLPSVRAPDFRRVIRAASGNLLVVGDWNQAELRVFGWLTACKELNAVFADPDPAKRDIHRQTAAAFAGIPLDQVTKEQRQNAKPFSFAAIYGGGATTLIDSAFDDYGIVLSEAEAAEKLDRWFERYPCRPWMEQHAKICQDRGFVETPSGRIIAATWLRDDDGLTYARTCNFPTQSTCADATLRLVIAIGNRLPGTLVAIVHDEAVLEVPEDKAPEAARILTDIMTQTFAETVPGAPLLGLVTTGIGVTWYDAKLDADKVS